MGSEKSQYWTQVLYKNKVLFYNPIYQNYGHINTIKVFTGETEIPIISVNVFSDQATFKFKEPFINSKVINRRQ